MTFDLESEVKDESEAHKVASAGKDIKSVLEQLKSVFAETPGRVHPTLEY